jgi:pilus assembly protein Flp/PilA
MTPIDTFDLTAGRLLARFCADESGATAIEYAMVAAGIGGVVAAAVMGLGAQLKTNFYDRVAALFP